jgi:hypothetical protein
VEKVTAKRIDSVTMTMPGEDCIQYQILYLIGIGRQTLSREVEGYDASFR